MTPEIQKLLGDFAKYTSSESILYAVQFAKLAAETIKSPPIIDLHPDGEISFTWRRAKNGIINIAFGKDGIATYAAFLAASEETHKGRFKANGSIPSTLLHLLHQIEIQTIAERKE